MVCKSNLDASGGVHTLQLLTLPLKIGPVTPHNQSLVEIKSTVMMFCIAHRFQVEKVVFQLPQKLVMIFLSSDSKSRFERYSAKYWRIGYSL